MNFIVYQKALSMPPKFGHVSHSNNGEYRPVCLLPTNLLSCYSSNGYFEEPLIAAISIEPVRRTFVDIGAHTGTYSILLSPKFERVISFEPQKRVFYALCGGIALSNAHNITAHNIALGSPAQVGFMTLKVPSEDGGGASILDVSGELRRETVEVKTLDDYQLENVSCIKIDVEENEYNVLLGAEKTISKWMPLIVFEQNGGLEPRIKELFQSWNYEVAIVAGNMYAATGAPPPDPRC